ncbi:hypothetical protein PM10SUCC1_01660 [Propionigenium maris DSM 9537]|uniref:DUF218 domain-containing protein n=1 Tax=Propionigenium maris DSM 9537 TaxID=1123000 RepID=A0A9W6GJ15_9FUSO|nr:ElyC/SanA/YdcF family protein [Propionigenium maris]GLI54651.1 hypothetical protein PM10SUCC1_01660 [Propionigenium maris DSM 9537]
MKKIILFLSSIFIALVVFIVHCNYEVVSASRGRTYDNIENLPYNRVGVVLGTSKYIVGGGLNRYYENRMKAARDLFFRGKVDYLLVSGDNALIEYNEPMRMKKSLVKLGVPEEKIYLDYAGFRTLDSVVRAREVFGLERFTVISQKFHNERAIYIGEKFGIDIVAYNAENPNKTRIKRREVLARVKACLDVSILNTQPKFLGDRIYIGEEEDN